MVTLSEGNKAKNGDIGTGGGGEGPGNVGTPAELRKPVCSCSTGVLAARGLLWEMPEKRGDDWPMIGDP